MLIRPEAPADYAAIGNLHASAFGNRTAEAVIVALLRQRRAFDPALALVAEEREQIVGHALFSPHQMRLLGQPVATVHLAPLAVEPSFQGKGIGGQLIAEGHRVAAAKGFAVSILIGHATYYPRFGYQTHAFGTAYLVSSHGACDAAPLQIRPPRHDDGPRLAALWQREEGAVDLALEPGTDLLDWLSPHPGLRSTVYTESEEVVGYTRVRQDVPTKPLAFLARDAEVAHAMLATMAQGLSAQLSSTAFTLPLHPFSPSAHALGQATITSESWAMACSLSPSPLEEYLGRVRSGERPPGRPMWPVAFDLD